MPSEDAGQGRPFGISLLIADVDGTILTSQQALTERTCDAVRRLDDAGIAFTITSSRPPLGLRMLVNALRITAPVAAFNGGMFVTSDMTVLEQHVLPPEIVRGLIPLLDSHGLEVWLYRGLEWLVRDRHGPHVDHEVGAVEFEPRVVPDLAAAAEEIAKVVGFSDDHGRVARCRDAAHGEYGDRISATSSQPHYVDITHPDANKGAVVDRLSALLNVPRPAIASIGDGPNDVRMFERSGLSIAVGNASAEVQRAAQIVTLSNDDDGFAVAVERYLLGHASIDASIDGAAVTARRFSAAPETGLLQR